MKSVIALLVVTFLAAPVVNAAVNRTALRNSIRSRLLATINRFSADANGKMTIIKTAGGQTITVKAGGKLPALGEGDKVSFSGGDVTIEVGGVTISGGEGTSFTVKNGGIAATGGTTVVKAGGIVATLDAGDHVAT